MLVSRMNSTNSFKNILIKTYNAEDTTEEVSGNTNTDLGGKKLHSDTSVTKNGDADIIVQHKDIKQLSYGESNDNLEEIKTLVRYFWIFLTLFNFTSKDGPSEPEVIVQEIQSLSSTALDVSAVDKINGSQLEFRNGRNNDDISIISIDELISRNECSNQILDTSADKSNGSHPEASMKVLMKLRLHNLLP